MLLDYANRNLRKCHISDIKSLPIAILIILDKIYIALMNVDQFADSNFQENGKDVFRQCQKIQSTLVTILVSDHILYISDERFLEEEVQYLTERK